MSDRLSSEELAATPFQWECGDRLRHVKTGVHYVISDTAFDEATKTPVYTYCSEWTTQEGYRATWVRARDVMEDGRFVLDPRPTEARLQARIVELEAQVAHLESLQDMRGAVMDLADEKPIPTLEVIEAATAPGVWGDDIAIVSCKTMRWLTGELRKEQRIRREFDAALVKIIDYAEGEGPPLSDVVELAEDLRSDIVVKAREAHDR